MPREMRFCRSCGCRLGEGIEEYTETVRFEHTPRRTAPAGKTRTATVATPFTSPTSSKAWAAASNARKQAMHKVSTQLDKFKVGRACKRVPKWVVWVVVPIFALSLISGGGSIRSRRNAPNSYLGSHYKSANGGAFIRDITPPGSAADKAGLVGGDTIISFDGKPVKSENDLSSLLSATPIGKTVEVLYIRDGETRTTKLTTISQEKNSELEDAFDDQAKGFLGVDDDFKRVQVEGTSLYGVQLDRVYRDRPASRAGLQAGDIIIEFGGTPIRTTEEFNQRIDRARPGSTVQVVFMRGGERRETSVTMGEDD